MSAEKKSILKLSISLAALGFAFCISLIFGTQHLAFSQIKEAFTNTSSFAHTVIFSIRLPRTLLAAVTGALLASSGAAFQMYFRNSLAEPGIMGISSGATLGAVCAQIIGASPIIFGTISPINIFAFAGALAAGGIIIFMSHKSYSSSSVNLLLCGTALGTFYAAISSILLLTKHRQLNGIYTWILGSFSGRGWTELKFILLPAAAATIILVFYSGRLDLMAGGSQTASALGLNTKQLRTIILVAAGLAVSAAVCAGGTISFVGLIAPHIVRRLFSSKGRILVTHSMIFGAVLVLLSDTIARTVISPAELPAGIITSLLGAPFFISLIFSSRKGIMLC